MPYVAPNYVANPNAKVGTWVCTRTSDLGPYSDTPPAEERRSPHFCGQCVSFVTTVCPTIPTRTSEWKKGKQAKGNKDIQPGTAIATFDTNEHYSGHAAIYDGQAENGIWVYDQWVTGTGHAIDKRLLRFGARGNSNNGDNFYVVE